VIEWYNHEHPNSAVLFTQDSSIAGAGGDVYENHWHQTSVVLRIREAPDLPALVRLLEGWRIPYLIAHKQVPGDMADPPLLVELLAACTVPEYEFGDFYLARLEPACNVRNLAEPPLAVPPGYYDIYDPAIVYRGGWKREQIPHGPDHDSLATAEDTGAEVSIAFSGLKLFYTHALGPDRGIASVTIDGKAQKPVDLYWPTLDWQHRAEFCCFGPGRHVAVVRATGEKNEKSSGAKIDLDSFSVQ
jgi:hypothetical protein